MTDLAYHEGPGASDRQRLDLYLPADDTGAPLLAFVHGGAWTSGDKGLYGWLGHAWASAGVAFAAVNYRLSPSVQHPAHVRDVARACAWLLGHADTYALDAAGLSLMGHSSGAHLVALAALDRSYLAEAGLAPWRLRAAIVLSGSAYQIDPAALTSPVWRLLYSTVFGTDSAAWPHAAPVAHVRADAPPFLIVHGSEDRLAPPAQSRLLASALQTAGARAELVEVPGGDHLGVLEALADPADPVRRAILARVRPAAGRPEPAAHPL